MNLVIIPIIVAFIGIYAIIKVIAMIVSKHERPYEAGHTDRDTGEDDMDDFIDRIETLDAMIEDDDD